MHTGFCYTVAGGAQLQVKNPFRYARLFFLGRTLEFGTPSL